LVPLSTQTPYNCYEDQFFYPPDPTLSSQKGEGIALISSAKSFGKGPLANGGGSGNSHNAGAAGGGNFGIGGHGGHNYEGPPCNTIIPFANGGINGKALSYTNATNKIFLAGGGGAGHTNSGVFQGNGGNGGGIIIIIANALQSNNKKISSNGNDAAVCGNTGPNCHEGMGGAGAGGTILTKINTYLDNAVIEVKGGKGGDMTAINPDRIGPGGGGGGGAIWFTNASLPANVVTTFSAGQNGVCTNHSNDPWGATAGQTGSNLFSLQIPIDNILFRPNIDSVRIKDSATSCKGFDFKGLGYTNTNPIGNWQWFFGDGGTANTQNTSHTYASAGTFTVKLIVTDINGCKDSITKAVTAIQFTADAGNDTTFCSVPPSVSVTLHASAGSSYSWTPVIYLNNPTLQNPTATVSTTTRFYVTITYSPAFPNCTATDSVLLTLIPSVTPSITITTTSNNICKGNPATFTAAILNGGPNPVYQWLKNGNPVGTNSNTYTDPALNNGDIIKCRLTSNAICPFPATVESNSIVMSVSNQPSNLRYPAVSALINQPLQLQARNLGGNSYNWQPPVGLNNNLIINPVFTYSQAQEYRIYFNTAAGCQVVDTQLVKIYGKKGIYVPRAFSPNGDGTNDRLYPILVGIRELYYFKVYNRWGNLIFETNSGNPASGWDGTYKGSLQPVETYTWVAAGIDVDGIVIKKSGNTVLLR
jgi:gliding motility-associated-like protein